MNFRDTTLFRDLRFSQSPDFAQLACFDGKGQAIFLWGQRAGGVGREGARRRIGAIEIEIDDAAYRERRVQHAAGLVGFGPVGCVFEQEVERAALGRVFVDRAQAVGMALIAELDPAGTFFLIRLAEDIQDGNLLDVRNELGLEMKGAD